MLSAVPLPPLTIAPACPIRFSGGAVYPQIKLTTGFVFPKFTNQSAAYSSWSPPISPIMIIPSVSLSFTKNSRQSIKFVPFNGSPPIPTTRLWPKLFWVV